MKNRKKLTAVALATVMGLSYTSYPVYAQEEIKKNVSNPVENVNAQEQNSKINETVTKQNETTKNNKLTNEVKMYAENNAGSFNVTSGTAGTDWTYDSDANTLTFNNSGTYTVTGDGTETQEKIVVAHNFEGTITINNININVSSKLRDCAFEVNNTATLTLNLKGENILKSGYGRAGLEFSNATTKSSLTITSDSNGKLTTTGGSDSAGIGGKLGSLDSYSGGNHITINSGTVIATAGGGAAGIGGGRWGNGENITINGGVVIATSDNGAGIGSGMDGNAENITITGGKIIATSNNGAGIGNGGNSGTAKKITISGGIVIAKATSGAGIGGGKFGISDGITISGGTVTASGGTHGIGGQYNAEHKNIVITGGSVKANRIGTTPTDGDGNYVYLAKIDNLSGVNEVMVDSKKYARNGDHLDDGAFYLYLTRQNHTVTANSETYNLYWNNDSNTFKYDNIVPTVTIADKTATSITVQSLADTSTYGEAEYSINNKDWQASNVFTGLNADTKYTVYARYKGNDTYIQSEAGKTSVKTMKDGSVLIEEKKPTDLTGVYGQKLSDITLTEGWTWVNGDASLSVGNQTYSARFDTTSYEDEYDFIGIKGYNVGEHYVELNLSVDTAKADTSLTITTESMDKAYDGKAVASPKVEIKGNTNSAIFTWYVQNGNEWKKLGEAPTNVGNYKVIAKVAEDSNYKEATAEKEFNISQTKNEWTEELSIADWIYGQTASTPTATAKYGNVVFTYSDKEDGTYTDKVPTEAGIWYVKATVEGNENYTGLKAIEQFKINQADSTIAFKNGFSLDKTYDTKAVAVSVDDLEITGSKGKISFTYEKKVGNTWEAMQEAPTGAGTYRVTASLAGDNNYKSAVSQPLEFTIDKADTVLEFTVNDLDKVYDGKTMVAPTNQVGNSHARVLSWYQLSEDGQWAKLEKAPVDAGSYKVVASVEADDNYNGAEIEMEFEITKAQPSYTLPTDLVIKQGESLSTLGLPDGFTWKDDTQTANTLGTQTFKAVFTPEDTTNYQTVEVDIRVDVVPTLILVNHVPTISADDKVVTVGDKFELMKDVTAFDKEDGDLTNKV